MRVSFLMKKRNKLLKIYFKAIKHHKFKLIDNM